MAVSLIRSRSMITKATSRHTCEEIKDGAVLQEDGIITAVGTFDDLHRKHPTVSVIGTGKEVLLPGFVNGHHHVGLGRNSLQRVTEHKARHVPQAHEQAQDGHQAQRVAQEAQQPARGRQRVLCLRLQLLERHNVEVERLAELL